MHFYYHLESLIRSPTVLISQEELKKIFEEYYQLFFLSIYNLEIRGEAFDEKDEKTPITKFHTIVYPVRIKYLESDVWEELIYVFALIKYQENNRINFVQCNFPLGIKQKNFDRKQVIALSKSTLSSNYEDEEKYKAAIGAMAIAISIALNLIHLIGNKADQNLNLYLTSSSNKEAIFSAVINCYQNNNYTIDLISNYEIRVPNKHELN